MEILESIAWLALGFIPTLVTLEVYKCVHRLVMSEKTVGEQEKLTIVA